MYETAAVIVKILLRDFDEIFIFYILNILYYHFI
jgi:hypothetical protein